MIFGSGLLRRFWKVVFHAACLVMIYDHRSVIRAARISWLMFWWDCVMIFDDVSAEIFSTVPVSHTSSVATALPAHQTI